MKTVVINIKSGEKYDVYIGRPSKWGNPFVIGRDGTRESVIKKYEQWILGNKSLLKDIRTELKGKVLGCWCKPWPCHGDVLAQLADTLSFPKKKTEKITKLASTVK